MKKVVITFGGRRYDETVGYTVKQATKLGADQVLVYDDKWLIGTEFYALNKWLWSYPKDQPYPSRRSPRGFGWFCWKPFIIMDALKRFDDAIILFLDGDTYPIANFSVLYDVCQRDGGIMLFAAQGQGHQRWCKRDCFLVMGQDNPDTRFTQAGVARFSLFQTKRWKVTQFLCEWLSYCLNPLAQTFEPSVILPEYPDLEEHRTEQAIMTNLAHKYDIHLYREACDFGNGALDEGVDRDLYPTLFKQVDARGPRDDLSGSVYQNVA